MKSDLNSSDCHTAMCLEKTPQREGGLWNSLLPHLRDADLPYSQFQW